MACTDGNPDTQINGFVLARKKLTTSDAKTECCDFLKWYKNLTQDKQDGGATKAVIWGGSSQGNMCYVHNDSSTEGDTLSGAKIIHNSDAPGTAPPTPAPVPPGTIVTKGKNISGFVEARKYLNAPASDQTASIKECSDFMHAYQTEAANPDANQAVIWSGSSQGNTCYVHLSEAVPDTDLDGAILIKGSGGGDNVCQKCPANTICVGHAAGTYAEKLGPYDAGDGTWIVCDQNGTPIVGKANPIPLSGDKKISVAVKKTGPAKDSPPQKVATKLLDDYSSDLTITDDGTTAGTDAKITYAPGGSLTLDNGWCLASTTKIPKVVNGNIQHVEVKGLKNGDMIRTTRGNFPLSHIMHITTIGPHTYVKVEQGALGKNLPSQDLYITQEHSFSLGYYKNSILNRNIHDPAQDDMVYLHITADQLVDKLPGITRVQKEFDAMFNLVFDEHVSLDIYGLEVMMHHPKGNPYTLPEEKYQDKTKINNKVQKPLFTNYGMLENVKPDHMEMKDFLRNCITANLDNKFRLEDIHHPSFAPQKTMLSEDMREKLRVN